MAFIKAKGTPCNKEGVSLRELGRIQSHINLEGEFLLNTSQINFILGNRVYLNGDLLKVDNNIYIKDITILDIQDLNSEILNR